MNTMFTRPLVVLSSVMLGSGSATAPTPCSGMASLALPNTTITLAVTVPAGSFKPDKPFPEGMAPKPAYDRLPAFCRVAAMARPTNDSEIRFEVWLPLEGWNGKFQAVGNGVWSGEIWYPLMAQALARGYATANTDTGHEGNGMDASFVLGHAEKLIDFGYRAVHEMTVQSKAIVAAYYGTAARYSYWNGCSSGGKQGLKEVQRYPLDYDGVIAGAPANNWTRLMASGIWTALATRADSASFIPPPKYGLIHAAILKACDALDGVADGVLDDPRQCRFDPAVLACTGADAQGCLTMAQVAAARKIYAGPKNPRTGEQIFPGLERGSETDWAFLASFPGPIGVYDAHFKFVVFADSQWSYKRLDFDADIGRADRLDNNTINATDPDLRPFIGHGGKLLLYHGWNDVIIAPRNTITYYDQVRRKVGATQADKSVRLFMAPGMAHCDGGEGPSEFDVLAALESWVEHGMAPDTITASSSNAGKVVRSRPLCAYPKRAKYVGTGSTNEAKNFRCVTP